MNIFRVTADYAYGMLSPEGDYDDRRRWLETSGVPSTATWVVPMLRVTPQSRLLLADCINSSSPPGRGMLLNQRARTALAPILLPCGEFLPVHVGDLDYQWFNCTTLIDVADQANIDGTHDPSPYVPPMMWMTIRRWAFRPELLSDLPTMFAVPQGLATVLMCSDVLVEAVEANDLLGFRFEHLWSSEHGGTELLPEQFFGPAGKARSELVKQRRKVVEVKLAERAKKLKPEAT